MTAYRGLWQKERARRRFFAGGLVSGIGTLPPAGLVERGASGELGSEVPGRGRLVPFIGVEAGVGGRFSFGTWNGRKVVVGPLVTGVDGMSVVDVDGVCGADRVSAAVRSIIVGSSCRKDGQYVNMLGTQWWLRFRTFMASTFTTGS